MLSHDYGDTVAQELIARDNESTSRPKLFSVALLNGGLFPETHRRVRFQSLLLSPVGPLFSRLMTKKTLDRTMRKVFGPKAPPDEPTLAAIWELITTNHGYRIFHKLIRYIPERIEHRKRWVGALQKTPVPNATNRRHVRSHLRCSHGRPLPRARSEGQSDRTCRHRALATGSSSARGIGCLSLLSRRSRREFGRYWQTVGRYVFGGRPLSWWKAVN
jgi:hypothetical protein